MLAYAIFSNADFFYAKLSNANFTNSDLSEANFRRTNLRKANFSGSVPNRSNLSWVTILPGVCEGINAAPNHYYSFTDGYSLK